MEPGQEDEDVKRTPQSSTGESLVKLRRIIKMNMLKDKLNKPLSYLRVRRRLAALIIVLSVALLGVILIAGFAYAVSPSQVRAPKLEHYHFRMQMVVNGEAENFGAKEYQTGYVKDQCNANLPEQPIHFHDKKDQFTHIHWEGMTGGMVMKYYGWNMIGGLDDVMGYKLDDLTDIQKVTTHGDYLPELPKDAKLYVYSGDEKDYKARTLADWRDQDLEKFFNKESNSPAHDLNKNGSDPLSALFPTASAHGDADAHEAETEKSTETETEKLTRINNLIGNVVIFVQKDAPTDDEIQRRFDMLVPLSESTCGG